MSCPKSLILTDSTLLALVVGPRRKLLPLKHNTFVSNDLMVQCVVFGELTEIEYNIHDYAFITV